MLLRQTYPTRESLEVDTDELRALIEGWEWPKTGWVLTFVTDQAGNLVGPDGTSKSLSNEIDKALLLGSRAGADAVLTSAKTARTEKYRRTSLAQLVIVSDSGNFDDIPALVDPGSGNPNFHSLLVSRRVVKAKFPFAETHRVGFGLRGIKRFLDSRALHRVLVETGPSLASKLAAKGYIRELRLSVIGAESDQLEAIQARLLKRLKLSGFRLESSWTVEDTNISRWTSKRRG